VRNQQGLHGVRRLLISQTILTMLVAFGCLLGIGQVAAGSAVLGGLVSILPSAIFARQLFKYHGAHNARRIVNGFYQGEALKIVISVALFAIVFILFKINPIVFFATYILVQMVLWFAPKIVDNKQNRPKSD
jgi:ATP synthase protein I